MSAAHSNVLKINILKEAAITSNSIEFDVAARVGIGDLYTYTDPAVSSPPQGDAEIQCPDHNPDGSEDGEQALRNAYTSTSWVMTDAYEYTFGYIMGYEEGLTAVSVGPAAGALLSVPTKGQQAFAQVDCGLETSEMTCESDPSPSTDLYNWEDYYFFEFLSHLDSGSTHASTGVAAGYAAACTGVTCSPSSLTTISPSNMSLVNTGLDVSSSDYSGDTMSNPGGYAAEPQCWINASPTGSPYSLNLYSSMTSDTPVSLSGTGVVLGWQTLTGSGADCGTSSGYNLVNGTKNGAQYLEIETDAAAETACDGALNSSLGTLLGGSGNPLTTCYY